MWPTLPVAATKVPAVRSDPSRRLRTTFGPPVRRAQRWFVARSPWSPGWMDPDRSALPRRTARRIQDATFHYRYNGAVCVKNPFDLAHYMRLLSELRPRTIVEIGTLAGGSAAWFAAQARGLGLDAHVHTFDLVQMPMVTDPDVSFHVGDITRLDESVLPGILAECPRPLLVVEDGPHTYEGSLAALRFFDRHLRAGEYIVVEDGLLKHLGVDELADGPNRAITAFLAERGADYEVDRGYCDFYGRNVTWNTNGYLRRRT